MNSLFSGGKKNMSNMKPQEKKLVDASEKILDLEKIKKQIKVIQLLNDEQASSIISNLSAKMKMIAEISILDQLGGLNLNSFYKEIKLNRLEDLKWKDNKIYNVYCKTFCDFGLIPSLNYSKEQLENNEPYKYNGLRQISEICIANKIFKFIQYVNVTEAKKVKDTNVTIEEDVKDKDGNIIQTCFTKPSNDKPVQILVRASLINSEKTKYKNKWNPSGIPSGSACPLSFEKLLDFSNFLLAGESSRVTSNEEKDKTLSPSAKKIDELKTSLVTDVTLTDVNYQLPEYSGERQLQEKTKEHELTNLLILVDNIISKLINASEFKSLLKVYLTIATNKNFVKFIKDNYKVKVGAFVETFGNQDKAVEIDDLDLDNQIQIDTRLDIKPPVPTVKTKKQIVNKK